MCVYYLLFVYAHVLQASSSADSCSILSGTHTSLRFNSWLMHGEHTQTILHLLLITAMGSFRKSYES